MSSLKSLQSWLERKRLRKPPIASESGNEWVLDYAASAGEEIPPPWVRFPGYEPWSGGWRQGNGEGWFKHVWLPFWKQLGTEGRLAYADKWEADSDWREYFFVHYTPQYICIPFLRSSEPTERNKCVGLTIALVGMKADPASMRWLVSASDRGFGLRHEPYWISVDDFDLFCRDLRNCANTKSGRAVLLSHEGDEFRLQIAHSIANKFKVQYSLARLVTSDGAQYRIAISGEFCLGQEPFNQLIEQLEGLRAVPAPSESAREASSGSLADTTPSDRDA